MITTLRYVKFSKYSKKLRETSLKIHIGHAHSSSDAKTCKECNRVFKTPGQLQTHVTNVHAKVKAWCEICQKHVSQAFFRMHNATVHNGKKAECQICQKSFSNFLDVEKHNQLEHNGMVSTSVAATTISKRSSKRKELAKFHEFLFSSKFLKLVT